MKIYKIITLLFIAYLYGCQINKEKDDYFSNTTFNGDLLSTLNSDPTVSVFRDLLVKYNYTNLLTSGNALTIWVPTNEAMNAYSGGTDSISIKKILDFSINYNMIKKSKIFDLMQVSTLGTKRLLFTIENNDTLVNEAKILDNGTFSKNGVMFKVDKVCNPLPNIWEYIQSESTMSELKKYINSYNVYEKIRVGTKDVNDSTKLISNAYLEKTKINDENSSTTYILLNNSNVSDGLVSFSKYFIYYYNASPTILNIDSTTILTKKLAIFNSLDFEGLKYFSKSQLPDSLVSRDNIKIPINKTSIKKEIKCSNGVAYELLNFYFKEADKFLFPITIEGEGSVNVKLTESSTVKVTKVNYYSNISNNKYLYWPVEKRNDEIIYTYDNMTVGTYEMYLTVCPTINVTSKNFVSSILKIRNTFLKDTTSVSVISNVYVNTLPNWTTTKVGQLEIKKWGQHQIHFSNSYLDQSTAILNLDKFILKPISQN